MDEVFKQAPDGLTYEEVETIFIRNDNNVLDTLIELWKIPEKNVNNISEDESKWANIRATCDDFDNEMKKVLDSASDSKKDSDLPSSVDYNSGDSISQRISVLNLKK